MLGIKSFEAKAVLEVSQCKGKSYSLMFCFGFLHKEQQIHSLITMLVCSYTYTHTQAFTFKC